MGGIIKEDTLPKAAQLPHETIATMVACLQACEKYVLKLGFKCSVS